MLIDVMVLVDTDRKIWKEQTISVYDICRIRELNDPKDNECWLEMKKTYDMHVKESRESLRDRANKAVRDE